MDTDYDFIQPEFFNILFFQQKNLVIYPYMDLKHLHSLEIFTAGYNVIDLDATAIHNLNEILEFETHNSYSQNPSLYLIYNLNNGEVANLFTAEKIRCILNVNQDVSSLAKISDCVFYNKKNKTFLNYTPESEDLDFETILITTSENEEVLKDKIQQIKIISSRIFAELNEKGNLDKLPHILEEYDSQYWEKILKFVHLYFKIEIPELPRFFPTQEKRIKAPLRDFSDEYELILKANRKIAQEFIQLLHEYRSKKVNPSHLELEQLYNPQKLYNYLRNHHWEKGIPEEFLSDWIKMVNTQYILQEQDVIDFEGIFHKLSISRPSALKEIFKIEESITKGSVNFSHSPNQPKKSQNIPSVKDFQDFKKWILKKLEELEKNL